MIKAGLNQRFDMNIQSKAESNVTPKFLIDNFTKGDQELSLSVRSTYTCFSFSFMKLEDIVSHPAFNGVYSLETWVSLLSWWEGAADMDASKVRRFWHIDWEETLGQTQDVTAGLRRPRGLTWRSWRRCWFVVIHNNLWGDEPMSLVCSDFSPWANISQCSC